MSTRMNPAPPYAAHCDDGVWYCDPHGTYDCARCLAGDIRPGPVTTVLHNRLAAELATAEAKAWDALGRYKFQMFGYWAAIWVHLNRLEGNNRPNPFKAAVELGRRRGKEAPAPPEWLPAATDTYL